MGRASGVVEPGWASGVSEPEKVSKAVGGGHRGSRKGFREDLMGLRGSLEDLKD